MKILFVFVLPSGGMDTLNRARYKALLDHKIEAHFLYFQRGSGSFNHDPQIPVHYANDMKRIGYLLKQNHFACIVVTSFFHKLSLFRSLKFKNPIIFEVQGFGPLKQARMTLREARKDVKKYANAILFPGAPRLGSLIAELYPRTPTFCFLNPFNFTPYKELPAPTLGGSSADPCPLMWVGRLDENKNWRDFLRIGAKLRDKFPKIQLWMFSDPTLAAPGEKNKLQKWADELNLSSQIIHFCNIENGKMPLYYHLVNKQHGVVVLTSKSEGACYVALEALSAGCPVVTSNSDGVSTSIINEKTGLYYELGDIEEASKQIIRFLNDDRLRLQLTTKGREYVKTSFTLEGYAINFKKMLHLLGIKG